MNGRLARLEVAAREHVTRERQAADEALSAWTFENVSEADRDAYWRWQFGQPRWPAELMPAPAWASAEDVELLRAFVEELGPVRPSDRETYERVRNAIPVELLRRQYAAWGVAWPQEVG